MGAKMLTLEVCITTVSVKGQMDSIGSDQRYQFLFGFGSHKDEARTTLQYCTCWKCEKVSETLPSGWESMI